MTAPEKTALSAVILAAGLSSRMHRFKPLLPLGDKTLVQVVIHLFQQCNILDILVVTGHNCTLLEPVIHKAGARPLFNPEFETGMLGSIQKGVSHLSEKSQGFFLLPVDIPAIRPATLQSLIKAFEGSSDQLIIPEFDLVPGHPPLIPSRLIPEILALESGSNPQEFMLSQKGQICLPVHDRGILMDADTPAAYDLLALKYQGLDIPDLQECGSMIRSQLPGETALHAHLSLVAETALKLGRAVNQALEHPKKSDPAPCLDLDLIQAAALLHDIKRREKNHAWSGSQFLKSLGFDRVADIVAQHMTLEPGVLITEKEIVYFADKLCNGTQVEPEYAQRFADKIKQAPGAQTRIFKRYEAAHQIHRRIEAAAGRSIRSILQ